jgi:hypothetical protein
MYITHVTVLPLVVHSPPNPSTPQVETSIARGGQGGQGLGPALVVQAMEAVVRLNKGFKTELATRQRPQIGR